MDAEELTVSSLQDVDIGVKEFGVIELVEVSIHAAEM